jgi:hypothetical protein
MPTTAPAPRPRLRDLLTIGQTWQHHNPDFSIQVKQIYRADRLLEAWLQTPDGLEARTVTFAELRGEYELTG